MATYAAKLDRVPNKNIIDNIVRSGLTSADLDVGVRGTAFYVDSTTGSSGNDGLSWDTAMATIDQAIDKCTTNKGDVVFVSPYHQEVEATAATSLFTLDIAGTSVIGVSNGGVNHTISSGAATFHTMPTLILDNATATITISGPNCRVSGFNIVSDVADVAVALTVANTADGAIIDNCVFRDNGAAIEYLVGISVAATTNYVQILNNLFETTAAGGTNNAILLAGADTGTVIRGNRAFGKYATGCVLGSAGKHTGIYLADNVFVNAEAAVAVALKTDSTGIAARNLFGGTTSIAAAWTGSDALWCFENYVTGAVNASAIIDPVVDAD